MGKIERMHRSMNIELIQGRSFGNFDNAQKGLDHWRETCNHRRPHEALDDQTTASRYPMSNRPMPAKLQEPEYHDHEFKSRVRQNGCLHLTKSAAGQRTDLQLSKAFAGQTVALRATEKDRIYHACFANDRIARADFSTVSPVPTVTHVLERL